MGLNDVPRCQHVKVNGTQCGSPALRRRRRCYFHEGVRIERAKVKADYFSQRGFEMPVLEDANAVQIALMKVLQMLARGTMEEKKAGLMLYGLQTASSNLKNAKFEAEKVTDVVIDCKSVAQTCIDGPQWFAGDFAEPTEEVEVKRDSVAAASGGEVAEVAGEPVAQASVVEKEVERARVGREKSRQEKARRDEARSGQRKRPGLPNLDDEPNSLAKLLLQQLGLPLPGEELGEEARVV